MIEKEVRALLPAWSVAAVALILAGRDVAPFQYLGVPLYFIAVAGLGAYSMGHEYTYGTLGSLLALPVPRWREWLTKLGVLIPMLVVLAMLGGRFLELDPGDHALGATLFWLPAVAALFIAPWLTMLARSPLAGAVFTIGIVGGSMALGEWVGFYRYGFSHGADAFRLMLTFMWWMVGGLSVVSSIAGWLTFSRLQVADSHARDLQLLSNSAAAPRSASRVRARRPMTALVVKELRLQQLALVVAATYTAGNLVIIYLGHAVPALYNVFELLVALYVTMLPTLVGSLAAAEERQFRTHDTQVLLPVSVSRQWLVKSATAIGLTMIMALLLPAALARLLPAYVLHLGPNGLITASTVVLVLGCLGVSLYVSSLAPSGLAALMYSIGALAAVGSYGSRVAMRLGDWAFALVHNARGPHPHHSLVMASGGFSMGAIVVVVFAAIALALSHYRLAEPRFRLAAAHAALAAAGIAVYEVIVAAMMALRY